jgi:hypothetical protein
MSDGRVSERHPFLMIFPSIGKAVLFAAIASAALPLGAWLGVTRPPARGE